MLIFLAVLQLTITVARGQTCADELDEAACRMLASETTGIKNLCTDPCLSKTCRKTCGMCPLQCYQCHSVSSPSDCHNITTCPTQDHHCIATESYDDNFEKVIQLGCATKDVCRRNFNEVTGKRSSLLQGGCCQSDLCNNNMSIVQTTVKPPIVIVLTTPAPPTNAPTSGALPSGTCADVNGELCTQLAFTMPDICSNDCVASKVCPAMCGRCLSCYKCDQVQHPQDCSFTSTCNSGETCYISETVNTATFERGYQLGCIDPSLCKNLTSSYGNQITGVAPVIGRRDHFHLSVDGDCCQTDFCNDRVRTTPIPKTTLVPKTTQAPQVTQGPQATQVPQVTQGPQATQVPGSLSPQATTAPSVGQGCQWVGPCPPNFHEYLGNCYNFGPEELPWDQALGYCNQQCSHLAELKTEGEIMSVVFHFRKWYAHAGYDQYEGYYVGAIDRGVGTYTWFRSGDEVDPGLLRPSHHAHTYDRCAVLYGDDVDEDDGTGFSSELCSDRFFPMCQTEAV